MRVKKKNLTMLLRKIPLRKKLKLIEWNLRNHDLWGPFPLFAQIEVDATCNLSCIMCVRNRLTTGQRLSLDQFKEIIDKLDKAGVMHIIPYGQGEALMHKDFVKMMSYVRSKGMLWSLVTNGTRMNDKYHDMIRLLKARPTYIAFSIDVPDPEMYEEIRPGAKFEEVKENFKNLVSLRDEMFEGKSRRETPQIDITTPLRLDTIHMLPEMIIMKDEWGANRIRFRDMVWGYDEGPSHKNNSIIQNMTSEEIELIMSVYKERNDIIWWLQAPTKRVCTWPKDSFYIDSIGDIRVCACGAETFEVLGNMFKIKDFIKDFWNGDTWNRVREETITGEHGEDFCKTCDAWHPDWRGI